MAKLLFKVGDIGQSCLGNIAQSFFILDFFGFQGVMTKLGMSAG